MRLILLGAPGTGKGTQASLLAASLGIPKISTGDILREAVAKGTELGRKVKSYIDAGELVPDEVMIDLVRERLREPDCAQGFILDGFPRTVPQAEQLDGTLKEQSKRIDRVIQLEVSREEILQRLTNRYLCRNCGKDYNAAKNPPPAEMKCTVCGGEITQRSDDTEATVRRRLEVYERQTTPLREYFAQQGKLVIIHGQGSIPQVFERLQQAIRQSDDQHQERKGN